MAQLFNKNNEGFCNPVTLPALGKRSPILNFYRSNLRRAFYFASAGLFLLIFLVFIFSKYEQWRYKKKLEKFGFDSRQNVITPFDVQLGPPPSILGNENNYMVPNGVKPLLDAPSPVPDTQAIAETMLDQAHVSGDSKELVITSGNQTNSALDIIPYYKVEVKPMPISIPKPEYPELAKKVRAEGQVVVMAVVDIDGSIMSAQISQSSGNPQLDEAAIFAARKARFTPAKQHDRLIRVWVSIPYQFRLSG